MVLSSLRTVGVTSGLMGVTSDLRVQLELLVHRQLLEAGGVQVHTTTRTNKMLTKGGYAVSGSGRRLATDELAFYADTSLVQPSPRAPLKGQQKRQKSSTETGRRGWGGGGSGGIFGVW